ncbi:hypothetical protein [Actinomadura sp. CNU-125]|uniref:hypothetical protein n=1 Tax=Actinomadura sp. CNU-125 TaxID=1904961 RepID=UPI000A75414C|nr:hypothetical protein [Actinomadura sp. CNU-125]
MNRARLVAITLLVVVMVGPAIWPAVLAYTFAFGEKGTATVSECVTRSSGRSTATTCRGAWRTDGGARDGGKIGGLDPDTPDGATVPVRIGPIGPYANGWSSRTYPALIPPLITTVPLLLAVPLIVRMRRGIGRRGRRLADSLLAGPGALLVSRDAVRRPDGSPYAVLRASSGPGPGARRLDLPGRPERAHRPMPGTVPDEPSVEFEALQDPDGRTLMFCEHRTDARFEPEIVLLAPDGTARLLVRREAPHPLVYRLLDPSGAVLGSARTRPASGRSRSPTPPGRAWPPRACAGATGCCGRRRRRPNRCATPRSSSSSPSTAPGTSPDRNRPREARGGRRPYASRSWCGGGISSFACSRSRSFSQSSGRR